MFFGLGVVTYAVIILIRRNLSRKDFKKVSLILKLGAYLGLIAFLFASF